MALVNAFRQLDRARIWFESHVVWAVILIVLASAGAVVFAYHESDSQSQRSTDAAERVLREHQGELHTIAVVAHSALLGACKSGRYLSLAVRANALHERSQARAIDGQLAVATHRAELVVHDPRTSAAVRAGAKKGLAAYAKIRASLDTNPVIPDLPRSCRDPAIVPSVATFEQIAKDSASSK